MSATPLKLRGSRQRSSRHRAHSAWNSFVNADAFAEMHRFIAVAACEE
jgi:hypothetical protein